MTFWRHHAIVRSIHSSGNSPKKVRKRFVGQGKWFLYQNLVGWKGISADQTKIEKTGLASRHCFGCALLLNCRPGRRGVPQTKSLIHLLFHMIATFFKIMVIFPVHFSMHFSTSYVLRRDFLTSIIIFHIKLIWE